MYKRESADLSCQAFLQTDLFYDISETQIRIALSCLLIYNDIVQLSHNNNTTKGGFPNARTD